MSEVQNRPGTRAVALLSDLLILPQAMFFLAWSDSRDHMESPEVFCELISRYHGKQQQAFPCGVGRMWHPTRNSQGSQTSKCLQLIQELPQNELRDESENNKYEMVGGEATEQLKLHHSNSFYQEETDPLPQSDCQSNLPSEEQETLPPPRFGKKPSASA